MKVNGEAVYGTRMAETFSEGDHIRFTRSKDGRSFIYLFQPPGEKVTISKMPFEKGAKLRMLGTNARIAWKQTGDTVEISIPAAAVSAGKYVWVLECSGGK
jgi:alpha-L-fucosidase